MLNLNSADFRRLASGSQFFDGKLYSIFQVGAWAIIPRNQQLSQQQNGYRIKRHEGAECVLEFHSTEIPLQ